MKTFELKKGNKIWYRREARNFPTAWASEIEVSDFLYGMVRMIKPEKVLEIGTFEGDASISIGKALKENQLGHLITTDIKDFGQEKNIADEKLTDYVTCIKENPNEFLAKEETVYDMAFIDDGHSYEECARDLETCHRLVKSMGFILGHDVLMIPSVNHAYSDFVEKYKDQYHKIIINSYDGLFILKKLYV